MKMPAGRDCSHSRLIRVAEGGRILEGTQDRGSRCVRLHVGRRRWAHAIRVCGAHLARGRGLREPSCLNLSDEGRSAPRRIAL